MSLRRVLDDGGNGREDPLNGEIFPAEFQARALRQRSFRQSHLIDSDRNDEKRHSVVQGFLSAQHAALGHEQSELRMTCGNDTVSKKSVSKMKLGV